MSDHQEPTVDESIVAHIRLIRENTCPVCHVKRTGVVNPRRALIEHLRRMSITCPGHRMWYLEHFATYFKHGGNRVQDKVTAEHLIRSIRTAFGDEWANKISIAA